jgi:hypothetical protein
MSNYINDYLSRVSVFASGNSPPTNIRGGLISHTKRAAERLIYTSPSYTQMLIDGTLYDTVLTQGKESEDKTVLLMPDTKINIGSVCEIGNSYYLVMDFLGEGINEIYPTAKLKLCNSTFPIQSDKTKVLIGTNDFDEDVYEYTESPPENIPCIVESRITSADTNEAINLPEGRINVTIPFKEHAEIAEGKEFTMYGSVYQIVGIDYTKSTVSKTGILTIQGKKV